MQSKVKCHELQCGNLADHDGYCKSHWEFLFSGMTNRQRMHAKKALRKVRKEQASV
jgi:hypothetical protein